MSDQESYNRDLDAIPEQQMPAALPNEDYYRQAPASQRGRAVGLGIALILGGLVWLAFMLFSQGSFFGGAAGRTRLIDRTLMGSRIEMDVGSADVDIRPWDGQGIHIEAVQRGGSPGDHTVDIVQSGDVVRVTGSSRPRFFLSCLGGCGLNYHVSIPGGGQVEVRTSSGDIDVEGAGGAVELFTVSGDVSARDLGGGATIGTTSGDVDLRAISGKLEVTTVSGDIELGDGRVAGAVVKTTSGDVELNGVADALTLASVSGDITVRGARDGLLTVSTTSGDFDYAGGLARDGEGRINSISGDVTLRLPDDSGFRLDASTISGSLRSHFDLRGGETSRRALGGVVGDGGATLKVETTSGDVRIERQ
jgi:hypothetical protein